MERILRVETAKQEYMLRGLSHSHSFDEANNPTVSYQKFQVLAEAQAISSWFARRLIDSRVVV